MKLKNLLNEAFESDRELRIKEICDDLKSVAFNVNSKQYRPAFINSLKVAISDLKDILYELEQNKR